MCSRARALPDCVRAGPADRVPRQDFENLALECASLKEQLVQSLEELSARERECEELSHAGTRCARVWPGGGGAAVWARVQQKAPGCV